MADDDEYLNYGDPETDPDAALLDDELRDLLNDFPEAGDSGNDLPAEALNEISNAVSNAWPEGSPPTPEELTTENAGHESYSDAPGFGDDHPGFDTGDHSHPVEHPFHIDHHLDHPDQHDDGFS